MRCCRTLALAGASMMALAGCIGSAAAQDAPPAQTGEQATEADDNVIIVTARRRDEALIDVPATVSAVTGKDLEEFQITNFEDISRLVSGLTLQSDSSGFNASAQTRGVQFQVTAQGTPTIEMYLNEVPIEPNLMFQGNFDIGQIEVLKGPQGTLRGRSAPSGAMTQSTRRPDLQEIGGYGSAQVTSRDGLNLQGGIGVPIINDMLALRVAGLYNRDDAGGIKSANSNLDPFGEGWAVRGTLRFEPTDTISAVVMYQRLVREIHDFGGVLFGNGALGLVATPGFSCPGAPAGTQPVNFTCPATANNPGIYAPPGFNGPVLTPDDRMNIQDYRGFTRQDAHIVTAQLDWRFAGQKLSYVGGYSRFFVLSEGDSDANNTVVGVQRNISRASHSLSSRKTHELRLSSDERLFDMIDYTVGGYLGKEYGLSASENANTILLAGAFGAPLGTAAPGGPGLLSPYTLNPKYVVGFDNQTPRLEKEKGLFANLILHIGDSTEISAGGRKIWKTQVKQVNPIPIGGFAAIRNPNGLGPCPATISGATGAGSVTDAPVVGSTYPGTCDVAVTLGNGAPAVSSLVRPIPRTVRKFEPFVYNFSLSHKFTPDLMAYATYGTAWRAGPGPITAAPVCAADTTPVASLPSGEDPDQCTKYNFLDPDKSKAFEVGLKAALFDRRLNFAVAVFKQKFSALFIRDAQSVPILTGNCTTIGVTNSQSGGCSVSSGTFTYGAPAKTKGIDIDVDYRVNGNLSFGGNFSWAKSRFTSSAIPCRDTNFDGVPDSDPIPTGPQAWRAAGGPFGPALCPAAGTSATTAPPWNTNIRGEFSEQVFDGARGFIRTLVNYYPKNKNNPDAVAVDGPPADRVPVKAYGIVNLFLGLRGDDGRWEITAGARNLFNNQTVLSRGLDQGTLISPGRFGATSTAFGTTTANNSGYRSISFVQPREFTLNLRYSFGAR